jgi:transcriptional repressor NrdR
MNCPQCAEIADKVIETRESKDGQYIRRRRECLQCGKRFTTYEKIEDIPLMVVKKDGRREPFDMDKIRKGLYRALEKRPVQTKQIEQLARQVEEFFSRSDREVPTFKIGGMIMEKLKKMDKVAYVRFAWKNSSPSCRAF